MDETTNKLFEAQVAVMGFKCRVMQLQGELDDRQREGWADTAGREEIEHLRTENATLRDDLKVVKEERDVAQKQKPSSNARIERVNGIVFVQINHSLHMQCSKTAALYSAHVAFQLFKCHA